MLFKDYLITLLWSCRYENLLLGKKIFPSKSFECVRILSHPYKYKLINTYSKVHTLKISSWQIQILSLNDQTQHQAWIFFSEDLKNRTKYSKWNWNFTPWYTFGNFNFFMTPLNGINVYLDEKLSIDWERFSICDMVT